MYRDDPSVSTIDGQVFTPYFKLNGIKLSVLSALVVNKYKKRID